MTGPLPSISDEDLQSFVDGELDPARKKAMLSRLAASPADAARAEAWRRQDDALRAAFAYIPTEPLPPSLAAGSRSERAEVVPLTSGAIGIRAASSHGFRLDWTSAVGMGVAFVAGAATTLAIGLRVEHFDVREYLRFDRESRWSFSRSSDEPFVDRTLRASTPLESMPRGPGADTGQSVDLLIVPNLSDAGLRLAGIRTAPGSPSLPLCLLYLTAADVEVTLCVDTTRTERTTALRKEGDLSEPAVAWRQKGARYSLAGALSDIDLGLLADRARVEIDKFASR